MSYDPYTYQPMMRHDFLGTPLNSSPHVQAVHQFTSWLKVNYPDVYGHVANRKPAMLDAEKAVTSGALGANAQTRAGLGDLAPVSDWGKTFTDAVGALVQGKAQSDLIKLNISRAEQGLPPIDPGNITPGVNVGLSADTRQLAILGIGGAILVGLAMAFKGARR